MKKKKNSKKIKMENRKILKKSGKYKWEKNKIGKNSIKILIKF